MSQVKYQFLELYRPYTESFGHIQANVLKTEATFAPHGGASEMRRTPQSRGVGGATEG